MPPPLGERLAAGSQAAGAPLTRTPPPAAPPRSHAPRPPRPPSLSCVLFLLSCGASATKRVGRHTALSAARASRAPDARRVLDALRLVAGVAADGGDGDSGGGDAQPQQRQQQLQAAAAPPSPASHPGWGAPPGGGGWGAAAPAPAAPPPPFDDRPPSPADRPCNAGGDACGDDDSARDVGVGRIAACGFFGSPPLALPPPPRSHPTTTFFSSLSSSHPFHPTPHAVWCHQVDSDAFKMYQYKVVACGRTRAHDWMSCPFAHPGEKAARRDPRVGYAAVSCADFRRGSCRRGDACPWAHGVFETWLHPDLCARPFFHPFFLFD